MERLFDLLFVVRADAEGLGGGHMMCGWLSGGEMQALDRLGQGVCRAQVDPDPSDVVCCVVIQLLNVTRLPMMFA